MPFHQLKKPLQQIDSTKARVLIGFWHIYVWVLLAAFFVATACTLYTTLHAWSVARVATLFHVAAFYSAWLMPLFLLGLMAHSWQFMRMSLKQLPFYLLLALGMYARFIEPNTLRIMHQHIHMAATPLAQPVTLLVISDLHVGHFSTPYQMNHLVNTLNGMAGDAILVAGDWTYEPPEDEILSRFQPLARLNKPIYAVFGNHDEEHPGPPLRHRTIAILEHLGVVFIENKVIAFKGLQLVGTGDRWAYKDNFAALAKTEPNMPIVALAHNPDSLSNIPRGITTPLLFIAGHTHGGQVNLPFITQHILKAASKSGYQRGLYSNHGYPVFVTSGIGMSGLPLRFRMPPTIDVLHLQ